MTVDTCNCLRRRRCPFLSFLGSARIQYLDADKYIYEGPYSIAFHSICNSTELSVIIFSRMSGPRSHIARTRPLIFEAVMCFHVQFDHFCAVKENATYALLTGAFI